MIKQGNRSIEGAAPSADPWQDLRHKAEALAKERPSRTPEDNFPPSPEEIRKTLHELRVHQIELEMQNEELRRAQTQIETGRARYFDLYDLAPVGYCTLSEQGLILEANLTAAMLLGTPRGALVKQPISRFILKDDQDIYYLYRKRLFETGEPQECELRLAKPDGASFWAHLTATTAQAEGGAPVCRVALTNITERKRAEETLKRSKKKLVAINADLERQTALAREMAFKAEQAARVKQQFLANMSHELRTPLNGVIAPADLLMEIGIDPEQHELAEIISSCGRNLLNLINDILDLSKVEAGAVRLRLAPVAVRDIIEKSLVPVAIMAKEKGLAFTSEVEYGVPSAVLADTLRVSQVLLNLAANAVKFTDSGEVSIKVAIVGKLGVRTLLRFSVRDTGIGFDEAYKSTIFEPFTQADNSDTRKYGGTGLGLAISKQMVELMDGEIGYESKVGEGSEFWFVVPLEEFAVHPATVAPAKSAVGSEKIFGGLRILLAEDNPANSRVAMLALKNMGVERITAVDDGAKAITALKSEHFDLVLMDCRMPEMDGYEATRAVRGGKSGVLDEKVPIIAMTANAMEGDRQQCLGVGMNDYIAKPINAVKLKDILVKWTGEQAVIARTQ